MATPLTTEQASLLIDATTVNIFNEHDSNKRRALMKEHWSEQITCFSPYGSNKGFDEIDQVWEGLHANEQKEWVFHKAGDMWLSANMVMQTWTFGTEGEKPGMTGWDVLIVGADGKVENLYALIDGVSTHGWQKA